MTLADSLRNVAAYIKLRSGKAIEIDYKAPLWEDLVKAADELTRLLALEAKLPKCWGLRDGVLVQDVVVVPGMKLRHDGEWWRVVSISTTDTLQLSCWDDGMHHRAVFGKSCCDSREAAEKRGDV